MTAGTFGQLLRHLRIERALSQNALAQLASIDPAYVNRLERSGQRTVSGLEIPAFVPSRHVVLSLAAALWLSDGDTDRFLFVAGLAPRRDYQELYERFKRRLDAVRAAISDGDQPTFIRKATG